MRSHKVVSLGRTPTVNHTTKCVEKRARAEAHTLSQKTPLKWAAAGEWALEDDTVK